ncbi:5-deoxy-glucuronate isomerase [Shinella zoogloeoides]|uniref:5-deoxy-glucuronate isomerase n=1 Tax=Shinella zoogloeoides TaxID=352475 RepID=UPI000E651310|nr:5-deoxy-glucuronate isomerase [Shinella zoogloeoides]
MSFHIHAHDNENQPIVVPGGPLSLIYFNLVRLKAGERHVFEREELEAHLVPLHGLVDIHVGGHGFSAVGGRQSIWDGRADSVYAGSRGAITIEALSDCEVAIAGAHCVEEYPPFRVTPEEVEMVAVGSSETHSRRDIYHLLGQNGEGRSGRLLVSELYCEQGCWSGYPPHKHDTDRDGETDHEELYHYRFQPETGFGGQFLYHEGEARQVVMTGHRDTVLVAGGYHPTVTSPGHAEYIFTILAGRTKRGLLQHFEERHAHLKDAIPGIGTMQAKFR